MGICFAKEYIENEDKVKRFLKSKRYFSWFNPKSHEHFSRVSEKIAKSRAKKLITASRAMNDGEGLYFAGICHEKGFGVKKNMRQAFKFYRHSAEKNWIKGIERIAFFYKNGIGCKLDEDKAFSWYSKGAEKGSFDAMARVSSFYENGYGKVKQNKKKSKKWKKRANSAKELERQLSDRKSKKNKFPKKEPLTKTLSWTRAKSLKQIERKRDKSKTNEIEEDNEPEIVDDDEEEKTMIYQFRIKKRSQKKKKKRKDSFSSYEEEDEQQESILSHSELNCRTMKMKFDAQFKEKEKKINELKSKILCLYEDKEKLQTGLDEEKQTHIRTQQSLRLSQLECNRLKQKLAFYTGGDP